MGITTATDRRFPLREHLKRPRDFEGVFKQGRFYRNALLTVVVAPSALPQRRLGLSVGKRVGNAVLRNRLKRRLRALYAEHRVSLPAHCDCVILAKPAAARATAPRLAAAVATLFSQVRRRAGSGRKRRRHPTR